MKWLGVLGLLWANAGHATPVNDVLTAAQRSFDRIPQLQIVDTISGSCGADFNVNQNVAYCTSQNVVYLSTAAVARPEAPYLVAHVLGHAVQVQHGVADVALREITRRRAEEPTLRGHVESQVDCIAGFLIGRAGLPDASLQVWFEEDPFAGTHWGRNPLRIGPQVQIGLTAREAWFQRGQSGDLNACAVGEFGSDLLLEALND